MYPLGCIGAISPTVNQGEVGKVGFDGALQHVGVDDPVFMKHRPAVAVDDADVQ